MATSGATTITTTTRTLRTIEVDRATTPTGEGQVEEPILITTRPKNGTRGAMVEVVAVAVVIVAATVEGAAVAVEATITKMGQISGLARALLCIRAQLLARTERLNGATMRISHGPSRSSHSTQSKSWTTLASCSRQISVLKTWITNCVSGSVSSSRTPSSRRRPKLRSDFSRWAQMALI